jgi:hypothetical protein
MLCGLLLLRWSSLTGIFFFVWIYFKDAVTGGRRKLHDDKLHNFITGTVPSLTTLAMACSYIYVFDTSKNYHSIKKLGVLW